MNKEYVIPVLLLALRIVHRSTNFSVTLVVQSFVALLLHAGHSHILMTNHVHGISGSNEDTCRSKS